MCKKCTLISFIADDVYRCAECGYIGRTDSKNPGHCPKCGHDIREEIDDAPSNLNHG